jgi:hypothetical protein
LSISEQDSPCDIKPLTFTSHVILRSLLTTTPKFILPIKIISG